MSSGFARLLITISSSRVGPFLSSSSLPPHPPPARATLTWIHPVACTGDVTPQPGWLYCSLKVAGNEHPAHIPQGEAGLPAPASGPRGPDGFLISPPDDGLHRLTHYGLPEVKGGSWVVLCGCTLTQRCPAPFLAVSPPPPAARAPLPLPPPSRRLVRPWHH